MARRAALGQLAGLGEGIIDVILGVNIVLVSREMDDCRLISLD